jgi:hypothetical protein
MPCHTRQDVNFVPSFNNDKSFEISRQQKVEEILSKEYDALFG